MECTVLPPYLPARSGDCVILSTSLWITVISVTSETHTVLCHIGHLLRLGVQLVGPFRERTDVGSIRICEATGLANVHPTWTGTFVLAGMVALYPHVHFALIDNDCLRLTLFEVAELWSLASPERVPIGSHSADREEPTRMESAAGSSRRAIPINVHARILIQSHVHHKG